MTDSCCQAATRYRSRCAYALGLIIPSAECRRRALFREESVKSDEPARQFPGAFVTDPMVSAELLRCLAVMVGEVGLPRTPGRWDRAWAKLRENPRDIPRAVRRSLHRSP